MKQKEFEYLVKVNVEMSNAEITQLAAVATLHYDHKCKAAGQEGGFLYGFCNKVGDEESAEVSLTSRQINLTCKILELFSSGGDRFSEQFPEAMKLWMPMRQLFRAVNDEYLRIIGDEVK